MDNLCDNLQLENESDVSNNADFSVADDNSLALENSYLQAKIICLEKNVKSDCIDDVLALAEKLSCENDDNSIDTILEKYPFFKNASAKNSKISTGVILSRTEKKSYNGIEAAFKKSNPNVKI